MITRKCKVCKIRIIFHNFNFNNNCNNNIFNYNNNNSF